MLDSISHRNYTVVSGVILVFALGMVVNQSIGRPELWLF